MTSELFSALLLFVIVTLFTPGPNNAMLMTSGLNFGFQRTLPHMFGVALGFGVMVLAVGLGIGALFTAYPVIYTALRVVGIAYLLYLAWAIATAGGMEDRDGGARPMKFVEAAAFQWVNPKAWVMAVGAVSSYAAVAPFPLNIGLIAGLFTALGLVSSTTWLLFGQGLRRILGSPGAVRFFNYTMAAALVASLYPVLAQFWK
jgi:threonine/homoserine/homoserine lactone efflux protein